MDFIDVAISFDTTGSMYPCLSEVRTKIKNMTDVLFRQIPNLRIAVIAHGDYCDRKTTYVTKILNFTSKKSKIRKFINKVDATHGGDAPECYELVLKKARTKLDWISGKAKVLVMIGDDEPHSPHYHRNTDNIDWENEIGLLNEAGIQVYGCHAMPGVRQHSKYFYKAIAERTNGHYLTLDQFNIISDLLMGVCYKQYNGNEFDNFVHSIDNSGRMTRGLKTSFINMGASIDEDGVAASHKGMVPVQSGRFQTFIIDKKQDIRSFIENRGITFKPGRGFYQLTKSVKVQQYKEIILVDKNTKDIYNGSIVREMLGLLPKSESGGVTQRLNKSNLLSDYYVMIQSTSYNRKLLPGTIFMYEVDDWHIEAPKPSKRKKDITIAGKPEQAWMLKNDHPEYTWVKIAKIIGYASGSSASRAAKRVALRRCKKAKK